MKNEHDEFEPSPKDLAPPLEVPLEALSADALRGVIENFILREGTDYGNQEISLESKVAQVLKQIEKRRTRVIFDPETESVTLMTEHDWQKRQVATNAE